jgi:hypothetical protein
MFEIKYSNQDSSSDNNILDDMKSLKPLETLEPPKFKESKKPASNSLVDLAGLSLSDKLKETSKKKKKKKSKWEETFAKYDPSRPESNEPNSEMSLEEYVRRLEKMESDEYGDDDIINEQRRGYDRLKREDNIYKKEFAEELTLLYGLLNESTHFGKKLDRKFDSMETSKVRGTTKFSTDLAMSIISVKGNKLAILKEIAAIKKTIADLKFKETKGKDESSYSMDRIASSYLKGIMTQGRGDFVKAVGYGGFDNSPADHVTSTHLNEYEKEDIDDAIMSRLRNEGNPYRTEEGSLNIEMETLGIKTMIKYNIDNGDWYFFNVDRDGQIVEGYPLPSMDKKIKWSEDRRTATDDGNGFYKVLEVSGELF